MLHLDRRGWMIGLAAVIGGELVAPLARAMAAEAQTPGFTPAAPFMTPAQRKLVAAAAERIVPTTDTPGAIAAGVPAFIEMMLGEWYAPDERALVMGGLQAMDAAAFKHWRKPYAALPPVRQDAVMTLASEGTLAGAPAGFFEHLRQLVVTGYYTSEIGCTVEQVYLPVPGHYDGAYPYAKVKRIFSS